MGKSANLAIQEAGTGVGEEAGGLGGQSKPPGRGRGFLDHPVKGVGSNAALALGVTLQNQAYMSLTI